MSIHPITETYKNRHNFKSQKRPFNKNRFENNRSTKKTVKQHPHNTKPEKRSKSEKQPSVKRSDPKPDSFPGKLRDNFQTKRKKSFTLFTRAESIFYILAVVMWTGALFRSRGPVCRGATPLCIVSFEFIWKCVENLSFLLRKCYALN